MIHLPLLALVTVLHGSWSITPSSTPGLINLTMMMDRDAGHQRSSSHDVTPQSIGLTAQELQSSNHVNFSIVRDAGTFACEGSVVASRGGGAMTFTSSPSFEHAMNERGYDVSANDEVTAAMLDISVAYVDAIASAGFPHLPFERLVAFRALNIDPEYVRSMRSLLGEGLRDPEQIISMRALNVTTAYVTELANVGYGHLSSQDLIKLRALGIDAAYVQRVKAHGFPHPSIEDLVRMKALNII